jgi:DNA polymerase-3 subunit beta
MAKPVEVTAARNVAQFNFGDYSVVTRLLEGNYPDVSQIIPDLKGEGVTIGRHLLLDACRRVALVGDGCRLEFRKTNLTIMSRSERNDAPGEAVESLLVANTKDVTVSVGARYLIEALAAIDSPEVSILAEKDTPLMLKAPGKPWLTVISTLKEVPAAAKAPAKK